MPKKRKSKKNGLATFAAKSASRAIRRRFTSNPGEFSGFTAAPGNRSIARRAKKNPAIMDADLKDELLTVALPAVGAYAATRLGSRIATIEAYKRLPRLGRHAGPVASLVCFGGSVYAGSKWEKLAPYRLGMMVGSGIAAVESILKTYLPGLGWIFDAELAPVPVQAAPQAQGDDNDEDDGVFEMPVTGSLAKPQLSAATADAAAEDGLTFDEVEDSWSEGMFPADADV